MLVAERERLDASALFGVASAFFSYSWTGSILGDVVEACERGVGRLGGGGGGGFLWLDMLCASQNLLAGAYEDARFPRGSAEHAARKEDTDNLFDGALDAASSIIFYLAPLVEAWPAPPHPYLRADRGEPPPGWERRGPRAISRAWCLFELSTKLAQGGRLVVELRPEDRAVLREKMLSDADAMLSILSAIDVNDAQVSKEKDREFICGRIEGAGGFDRVNALAMGALREWLAEAAREALREAEEEEGGDEQALLRLLHAIGGLLRDMGRCRPGQG